MKIKSDRIIYLSLEATLTFRAFTNFLKGILQKMRI